MVRHPGQSRADAACPSEYRCPSVRVIRHFVPNADGWHLALTQRYARGHLDAGRPPVLIVPGYGMNSFIFGFHPTGVALTDHIARAGFEVWTTDLRGQGHSVPISVDPGRSPRLEDLAMIDLPAAIDGVLERTRTHADHLIVVGASLGGTLMLAYAALAARHKISAMVTLGSPLRWVKVHPLVRVAFASPALAGLLPIKGTRKIAGAALPLLTKRAPKLVSMYLNTELTDTTRSAEMVETVEDPSRALNKEIARWIKAKDLTLRHTNVTDAAARLDLPLMVVAAHGDGVVPLETAIFPYGHLPSRNKELVIAGDVSAPLAHADLFVSRESEARVFTPLTEWLTRL